MTPTEEQKPQNAQTPAQAPAQPSAPPAAPAPSRTAGRGRAFLIFFAVLAVLAIAAFFYWQDAKQFESTDDAFIDMHLDPLSARVDGTIVKVYVEENQFVHAGDPLVDLDPRDLQVSVDQAQSALTQAGSMVTAQQPNISITQAENTGNISASEASIANAQAAVASAEHDRDTAAARLTEAEANSAKAQADLARYKILIAHEEISQQEYDQVDAAAKAQAANVAASRSAVESAARVVDQRRAQVQEAQSRLQQYRETSNQQVAIRRANVQSQEANRQNAKAQLEQAQLKLSYTRIVAPVDGIVLKRSAEVGARVSAGQQLISIAEVGDLWVTANFKETQLARLQPGQSATLHVDALKLDFQGKVENIGGATGAVASVLPPENATGNYVKVVQRIPVRLRLNPGQQGMDRLRAGMSVEPEVRVEQ
jgi:membrane fusion protein (multidrug efflux system)